MDGDTMIFQDDTGSITRIDLQSRRIDQSVK